MKDAEVSAAGTAAAENYASVLPAAPASPVALAPKSDPQWYRDAIIYEVHVRSFHDSNADGIGDFRGLTEKLDYLCDLGVTALWLLPFYPSPLRDDGYDIADYTSVNPAYGKLRDVETFIREAHRRGLRVITELVCNHTSDQHPWFQRARKARPGSPWRDFYVWSDTPYRYTDARIIFKDFETSNWTWDPVAGAYYWHRFYSHQPDLNFDNPRVRAAITKAMDFWLQRGVDGLRLDAIPYLFEREGTDCENLPETHEFLRELRHHVDKLYGDRLLLAEANQWPEESAAYFGNGDECHMAFNFPVMPRMFMAIRVEDRLPIVDIIEQTPPIPETAQWALFLRNHDELTLEMVTDEERDYMYRTYADDPRARINLGIRRRLAPLLGNHRRRIELMNGLLFSLPGTPVIYYGDEIGMGDNVYLGDRDSVRTPMQWNGDRNAGFSTANREQLYLPVVTDPENHFEAVNVSVQQANPHSLLWWNKRLIALRKRHPAFGRGDLRMLHPANRHVLAFIRSFGDETILVVANLSRFFQPLELDLANYEGRQPIEMFGRIEFPTIGRAPYPLSLGPHEFLWFTLEPTAGSPDGGGSTPALPTLAATQLGDVLGGRLDGALASILLRWIRHRAWYRGHGRRVKDGEIVDRIDVRPGVGTAVVIVLRVNYSEGEADTYLIPLTTAGLRDDSLVFADGTILRAEPAGTRVAALISTGGGPEAGLLVDASFDEGFIAHLVDAIARGRLIRDTRGELRGRRGADLPAGQPDLVLELRHAFEPGRDPEAEVMGFLTSHGATWAPRMFGELEYRPARGPSGSAALLREQLVHDGDLAETTREALLGFLEQAATAPASSVAPTITTAELIRTAADELSGPAHLLVGSYLTTARSIGNRIGDFHALMASAPDDPDFAPEPFTRLYQRSLYQSIDAAIVHVMRHLGAGSPALEGSAAADALLILRRKGELRERLQMLLQRKFSGSRIRIHGDLKLSQVMRGERGLVMIDFEGDASRPAGERLLKRSALRDVAGMIRSFHDVALGRMRESDVGGSLRSEDAERLDVWARQWFLWVSASFLRGYRETAGAATFLPAHEDEWACLLDAFLIHRLLEDLDADLRNDPTRVASSLRGLLELLGLQER